MTWQHLGAHGDLRLVLKLDRSRPMTYAADTYSWTWHWRDAGGRDMYNVLHFNNGHGSPLTSGQAATITAKLRSELAATAGRTLAWRAYIDQFSGLNDQVIKDVSGGTSFEYTDSTVVLGTATTDQLPPQVSLLVQAKTALAGRRNRGRIYLAPFAEGFNDATGDPTLALRNDVATALENIRTDMIGNSNGLVVASQVGTPASHAITQFLAGSSWRTQRRRSLQS